MQGTKLAKLPFPEGSSRDGFFCNHPSVSFSDVRWFFEGARSLAGAFLTSGSLGHGIDECSPYTKKTSDKINRDIKLDNPPCSVGNKSSNGLFSIVVLVYQSVNIPTKQRIGQKHHVCRTSKVFW